MASPATSPAQYPAGSGVGVSVLLRPPHGFEGPFLARKDRDPGDLAVDHGVERGVGASNRNAAAPAASRLEYGGKDRAGAEVGEALDFIDIFVERPHEARDRLGDRLVSVGYFE